MLDLQEQIFSNPSVYTKSFVHGFKADPVLSVSKWADMYRVLSSVASGEPGKWNTSRTPYLREIMDCLSPSSLIRNVVFMKGAQIGGTEAGLNWLGYVIHKSPGPIMMVNPTLDMAKRYSKHRIDPMLEANSTLNSLVQSPRSRDSGNTTLSKEFPGGVLVMTGANSATGLRSMPVRYLFMDEVDAFPGDVNGEGDPVALAVQRTVTFTNRKIFMVSTPTVKGFSRIEKAFLESDQRRYWVPCPHCNEMQVLEWKQVKWPEGNRSGAYYECPYCKQTIYDYKKSWMLERGEWRAGRECNNKTAGFHLSSLYSPHGWVSWSNIAEEHGLVYRDPSRLKVWVNTKLGETWEEEAEQIIGDELMQRREQFGEWIPAGVIIITCGVDVQDNRLEVEFVGWGRDEESWSLDYKVLYGDPSSPELWDDLDKLLRRTFASARQIPDLAVRAVSIDTGGHYTLKVYDFVRYRQARRIWAIKGKGGMGYPIWPKRPNLNNKGRVPLFTIGVDTAKEAIYARLRLRESGPGYCHFPQDRDAEWFKQLTAERVTTRYLKGHAIREWKKRDGDHNEALDCRVYAMAALHGLISMGLQLNKEADKMALVPMRNRADDQPVIAGKRVQRREIKSTWMG